MLLPRFPTTDEIFARASFHEHSRSFVMPKRLQVGGATGGFVGNYGCHGFEKSESLAGDERHRMAKSSGCQIDDHARRRYLTGGRRGGRGSDAVGECKYAIGYHFK